MVKDLSSTTLNYNMCFSRMQSRLNISINKVCKIIKYGFSLNTYLNEKEKLTFCALSFWKTNTGGAMAGLSVKKRCGLVIQALTQSVQ